MPHALYNEIDPYAAQWLRNLIQRGLIAPGDVAECSIADLTPADLRRYRQVHFFAGIGVWSYALRRAGFADTAPVWTGSCPCQPFSAAGKGTGFADERHLWPHMHYLIEQCQPRVVLGEQVASKDGLAWFDLVQSDLENTGYTAAAVDSCSAGFGAPHIRQRLYWMAHSPCSGRGQTGRDAAGWREANGGRSGNWFGDAGPNGSSCQLADAESNRSASVAQRPGQEQVEPVSRRHGPDRPNTPAGPTNGFWRNPDWLLCRDGKWRPVESGTFPLVDGSAFRVGSGSAFEGQSRVGMLRGYGNAINAEHATAFCEAVRGALESA